MPPVSSPPSIAAEERLIFALDAVAPEEALELARALSPAVRLFKVGFELFCRGGWEIVERLAAEGALVFLDLKLLDIAETVARTLAEFEAHAGIRYATIHAFNRGLRERLGDRSGAAIRLLVVTLLTSQNDADLEALGIQRTAEQHVLALASQARALGGDGVIASGAEVAALKRADPGLLVVTPGIRPAWGHVERDDQKRIATPEAAIAAGADHIVVGRPIRTYRNAQGRADPREAAERIQQEIRQGLRLRTAGAPGR